MKKIYLATPYQNDRENAFKEITIVTGILMQRGLIVYSPITHNHPIAMSVKLPTTWTFWKPFDLVFLKWCDILYVYKRPGWEKSVGVTAEIALAIELRKEIVFIERFKQFN